jgi:Raf kinase inhibitor-like YbhB/YbcL family protein
VAALVSCALAAAAGPAAALSALTVTVDRLKPGGAIPPTYAYCVRAAQGHVTDGPNRSPAVRWSRGPAGTASYAIIVVDTDVPTVFTSANKEGQTIPASLKRRPFYHWILVDIPPAVTGLPEGADASGVIPQGKPVGLTRYGLRGANDYSGGGAVHGGYDGPCPPWNDAIVHHYHFIVYALDVRHLGLSGAFTGQDATAAIERHALARGEVVGLYATNPDVAGPLGIR